MECRVTAVSPQYRAEISTSLPPAGRKAVAGAHAALYAPVRCAVAAAIWPRCWCLGRFDNACFASRERRNDGGLAPRPGTHRLKDDSGGTPLRSISGRLAPP